MLSLYSCATTWRLYSIGDQTQNFEHTSHSTFITMWAFTEKEWDVILVDWMVRTESFRLMLLHGLHVSAPQSSRAFIWFLKPIFILNCVQQGEVCAFECRCLQRPEVSDLPGAGVSGDCELIVPGAGYWTRVLWKNTICSTPLIWYLRYFCSLYI